MRATRATTGPVDPIPERSAQRIFKAADQILKAGDDHDCRTVTVETSVCKH